MSLFEAHSCIMGCCLRSYDGNEQTKIRTSVDSSCTRMFILALFMIAKYGTSKDTHQLMTDVAHTCDGVLGGCKEEENHAICRKMGEL